MKNKFLFYIFLFIFIIFASFPFFKFSSIHTSSNIDFGRAIVSILNSDNTPIQNATLCVVETQERYTSNKLGIVELTLPTNKSIIKIKHSIPQQNWTEYTLIIYSSGNYPHIYFGLKITPNQTKTGIIITPTNRIHKIGSNHTESYEFPPEDWTQELIDKNKTP